MKTVLYHGTSVYPTDRLQRVTHVRDTTAVQVTDISEEKGEFSWVDPQGTEGVSRILKGTTFVEDDQVLWGAPPKKGYSEWIEFAGIRWPCKLTPKGIALYAGYPYDDSYSYATDKTLRYRTDLPDWWTINCQHRVERNMDGYSITNSPIYLPVDYQEASPGILRRLQAVSRNMDEAEAAAEEKKREHATREEVRTTFTKWATALRQQKDLLIEAALADDTEILLVTAAVLREMKKNQPRNPRA